MAEPCPTCETDEQHGHHQGAAKGRQRQPPARQIEPEPLGHRHRHHGGQPSAARDAEQAGFRHRIVQHHLEHGTAAGKGGPRQQSQQGARQAQLQQDAQLQIPQRLPGQQHELPEGEGEQEQGQGQQRQQEQPATLPALLATDESEIHGIPKKRGPPVGRQESCMITARYHPRSRLVGLGQRRYLAALHHGLQRLRQLGAQLVVG